VVKGKKILAIIPARSGSKRLPRKNIIDLNGKPLIAWSIEAGLNSKYVDRVIVSTDDIEIAKISEKWGADIPFIRPKELATDTATTVDVIMHAIINLKEAGEKYDYIMLLQPTSPLRSVVHVDESIELLEGQDIDNVVGITEVSHPYEWTNTLPHNMSMDGFISDEAYLTRSQDFPKRYQINGAIYLIKEEVFLLCKKMISNKKSIAYIMDQNCSIDIDTENDFLLAECVTKKL
jgi:CMP-N-acetylneuraminic acid synthetase